MEKSGKTAGIMVSLDMRITLITLQGPEAGADLYESGAPAWLEEQEDRDFEWLEATESTLPAVISKARGDYIALLSPHEKLAQTQTIGKLIAALRYTRFDLVYGDVAIRDDEEDDDDSSQAKLRHVGSHPLQIPFSFGHVLMNRMRLLAQHNATEPPEFFSIKNMISDFISHARTALYLKFPVTIVTLRLARFRRAKDSLTCKPAIGSRQISTALTQGRVMVLPSVTRPVNDQPQTA